MAYYKEMVPFLKSLGVKCPITGTNQDWSDASSAANSICETMTRNNYWNLAVASGGKVSFGAQPLVWSKLTDQGNNPIANVASSSVAGKPMLMPEMNFPWPNEWRAECLPLMASYARLQDWDGIVFFNYEPGATTLTPLSQQLRSGSLEPGAVGCLNSAARRYCLGSQHR